MPTIEEVARAALADVGETSAGLVQATRWVNERYQELASRMRLRQHRTIEVLTIPAAVITGTLSVTKGSGTVTGNAAAQAVWSANLKGRFLRAATAWYEIEEYDADTPALLLKSNYAEDTNTAASYQIVQRYATLPRGTLFVHNFLHERRWLELDTLSLDELDYAEPNRTYLTGGPLCVAEVGPAADGRKRVEIFPYSEDDENVRYTAYMYPETLPKGHPLPDAIDLSALKEGVLVNVYRWKMSEEAKKGAEGVAMTAFWRNEMRAQMTTWQERLKHLAKMDTGIDDSGMVLRRR